MFEELRKSLLSFLCICMSICVLQPQHIYASEPDNDYDSIESYEYVEPTILQEDESKREEASKTFILSDKTYQKVLYSIPVHYEEDGEWKEIDNTLTEDEIATISSDEVSGYMNKKSKLKIKFSKKMHEENLASISVDKYSIKWGIDDFEHKSEAVILKNEESNDENQNMTSFWWQ